MIEDNHNNPLSSVKLLLEKNLTEILINKGGHWQ